MGQQPGSASTGGLSLEPKSGLDARRQLRGRQRLISELALKCVANDLLVLHGQSGAGKSSVLNVGLIPQLESLGKTVVLVREWGTAEGRPPAEFVTSALGYNPFDQATTFNRPDHPSLGQLVIILDQFEELIRNDPAFAREVMAWLQDIVGRTSAKFVISLRSEYEFQVRGLHTRPFSKRDRVEIPPVMDLRFIELVIGGNREDPEDRMPIADEAIRRLREEWVAVQSDPRGNVWNRPGLLHLQATLYVLWMRSRKAREAGEQDSITADDVDDLIRAFRESREMPVGGGSWSVFDFALGESVGHSVNNCVIASGSATISGTERLGEAPSPRDEPSTDTGNAPWTEVPRVLIDQTRWLVRDMSEHLASGGYKTPQDMWGLARRVLAYTDDEVLRDVPEWAEERFASQSWFEDAASQYGIPAGPASSLGSGPAAGLSTEQLLFELYRAFFLAVEWMTTSNIAQVRRNGSSYQITLTHDRFDDGLRSWRRNVLPGFHEATARYAATRGKANIHWDVVTLPHHADRVVANVRWTQCTVTNTHFENITFVNCTFDGSTFDRCTFAGVTLVNCSLEDVDFLECSILGSPTWRFDHVAWSSLDRAERERWVEEPQDFDVPVSRELALDLVALLGTEAPAAGRVFLYSPVSGKGEVAVVRDRATTPAAIDEVSKIAVPDLPTVPGGLVWCGGRLSSLTFRRCTFSSNAVVELRYVAGSSLEVCEQTHGDFRIFAAAIRGLSVTLPLSGSSRADSKGFEFDVRHAKIINTWFGVGVTGLARFVDCQVWQLINAAGQRAPAASASESSEVADGLRIEIDNSGYFGLINTGPITNLESLPLGVDRGEGIPCFTESTVNGLGMASLTQVSDKIDVQSAQTRESEGEG